VLPSPSGKIPSVERTDIVLRVGEMSAVEGLTLSGKNPNSENTNSEWGNSINRTFRLKGLAMAGAKKYQFIQYWQEIHGIGGNDRDMSVVHLL